MAKKSKKYIEALNQIEKGKAYTKEEAVELVKKVSTSKFDGSVEVAMKLNLDTRKSDQQLRGSLLLPHGTGKTKKVLVIAKGDAAANATAAGADYVGDKEILDKIKGGWFDFDVIVATPDMMGELGKLGKILGPKGLMPNPKTGTVTPNVAGAVAEIKKGKVEYRVDKDGNINCLLGKVSFDAKDLESNFNALAGAIVKARPAAVKGAYITGVTLSSNMGPGIKVDFGA